MPNAPIVPTESQEQCVLVEWANLAALKTPELNLLYHIPNGGHRNKAVAAKLKAEGVKSGVPDFCLPVARRQYHGLYIELKRTRGGRLKQEQKLWITALTEQGYLALSCRGFDEARQALLDYLSLN